MRLLLVEDDLKLATFIAKGLREAGFALDHCADGEDGLYMASTEPYDAAIIDIMLPKRDGLSLIDELRKIRNNIPVIILSAKRSVDDRIRGLQAGGDDYLVKPFSFAELLARIQALIRRASGTAEPTVLVVGDLSMDLRTRKVTRGGQKIDLRIGKKMPYRTKYRLQCHQVAQRGKPNQQDFHASRNSMMRWQALPSP